MPLPKRQRQWDLYRAHWGEGPDIMVLVLSSDETNRILDAQVLACEVVPESLERLPPSPVTIAVRPEETGLDEAASLNLATLASLPKSCLVGLEGRLESVTARMAVLRGIEVLVGAAPWP